jgi:hypothetical protein
MNQPDQDQLRMNLEYILETTGGVNLPPGTPEPVIAALMSYGGAGVETEAPQEEHVSRL